MSRTSASVPVLPGIGAERMERARKLAKEGASVAEISRSTPCAMGSARSIKAAVVAERKVRSERAKDVHARKRMKAKLYGR